MSTLTADDNATLMKDGLDDLAELRLRALISIEENKKRVAKWYDKKVKTKEFVDGDLVWKLIVTPQCYGCINHMHNMSIIIYSSIA